MSSLEEVLELVRGARENIECGRVNDAGWFLYAIEEDLVAVQFQTQGAIFLWNAVRQA